ncbi:glycoside hydrolase family 127 protein [Asticcacaulis sp. BYS171W]|uniref:Glycoside hydrolase family 127 protein n=1 Tax=Asticcacaulis aquaticus TaxID=2984212 RepID=A0ABT5HU92_9CAUL|nr:glycoside hydrolase family 127 protein [Asticcacaulis aquaticus]MDC7683544.1 glycoside hydrolase family 127 protein [Asticcacaulis aquaticus]
MDRITRRGVIRSGGLGAGFMGAAGLSATVSAHAATGPAVSSFPLAQVRLRPSPFLTSIEANQRYLLALSADRLLHNFRAGAGLEPKGAVYGGWEARGIAGHSLGHYLSALSLMYAQTGDVRFKDRAAYVVQELKTIQARNGDGYAGGTTVDRGGKTLDGKIVYEELRKGDIRTGGFDLNGGWVPLYTYHKVFAGALDAHRLTGDTDALGVAVGLGDYLGTILEGLSDEQIQQILRAEHGGLNESFAELHARTGHKRWLTLAERVGHKAILDPLSEGRDELNGKHANTQIPKVIGAARLYELTHNPRHARTAMFFWETVTKDHSYVIGGNSDHEHFGKPKQLSTRLDQQTCEACNSYNMLRLTRHLYGWSGKAAYFDYFERAHLNHIMSQQDPKTGMFTYFTPLVSGFGRVHSDPENDFWCCVGSGMESHSKHGESIYWKRGSRVIVNLYYASTLNAPEAKLTLDSAYPYGDTATITVQKAPKELALRVPNWCTTPSVTVNNKPAGKREDGYIVLSGLKAGDKVAVKLPMPVRVETMPDDERVLAFLSGPLVLAADLGPTTTPWEGFDPAVVSDSADNLLTKTATAHSYTLGGKGRPDTLKLRPFLEQHHNRTAVYFRRFGTAEWVSTEASYVAAAKERADIRARTVDVIRLGEQQPEKDHNFDGTPNTATITHIAERGRLVMKGFFEFDMAVGDGPLALQVTYGGRERNKAFRILVDGKVLAEETLSGDPQTTANLKTYPLAPDLTTGKSRIRVRFEATRDQWAFVYEARIFRTSAA